MITINTIMFLIGCMLVFSTCIAIGIVMAYRMIKKWGNWL